MAWDVPSSTGPHTNGGAACRSSQPFRLGRRAQGCLWGGGSRLATIGCRLVAPCFAPCFWWPVTPVLRERRWLEGVRVASGLESAGGKWLGECGWQVSWGVQVSPVLRECGWQARMLQRLELRAACCRACAARRTMVQRALQLGSKPETLIPKPCQCFQARPDPSDAIVAVSCSAPCRVLQARRGCCSVLQRALTPVTLQVVRHRATWAAPRQTRTWTLPRGAT